MGVGGRDRHRVIYHVDVDRQTPTSDRTDPLTLTQVTNCRTTDCVVISV